jgi:hypothetical protein
LPLTASPDIVEAARGEALLELLDDPTMLRPDLLGRGLSEDRAHQGGDQGLLRQNESPVESVNYKTPAV